ncbi:hypothetical protein GJU40_10550 [Bacillus lacus]|uniref:Membrane protein YqhR n=1 Tax=Metabacillus lacus TaxID=1983721 RepID=A0A7X2IZD8_9BACI|nr:YqhR family membrane protein [Metabacillus lacus]MRX72586.1 hypothetical protein [Metabacillus lacus]
MEDKNQEESKKEPGLEQNKREQPLPFIARALITGFIGGVLWASAGWAAHIFNFTEIEPNMILQPVMIGDWKNTVLGNIISILVIGLLSVGSALGYFLFLKSFKGMWMGMVFGLALWGLVFLVLNPIFPDVKTIFQLKRETVITSACLYLLYGVFVGYSISFEHNEMLTDKRFHAAD